MRFLLVDTDYEAFQQQWRLAGAPSSGGYAGMLAARRLAGFGAAQPYAAALRSLGHQAEEIYANDPELQRTWAGEHSIPWRGDATALRWRWRRGVVPWPRRERTRPWMAEVLAAQVRQFRPDVLLVMNVVGIVPSLVAELRHDVRVVLGQHAASALPESDWRAYDLMTTSFGPTADWFAARGAPCVLQRLAFDPGVLPRLADGPRLPVTFVGSFHPVHGSRLAWLEEVCAACEVHVSTPDASAVPAGSPIRRRLLPPCWGIDMLSLLRRSAITLNHHGDVADYANNMRLYEATGTGCLLVTDRRAHLGDLFAIGDEVAAYDDARHCVELVTRYLADEPARAAMAAAGQRRTLAEHTYERRAEELVGLLRERFSDRLGRSA